MPNNPVAALINRIFRRKSIRTCPRCKRDQVVPPENRMQSVECKFCGEKIPPQL